MVRSKWKLVTALVQRRNRLEEGWRLISYSCARNTIAFQLSPLTNLPNLTLAFHFSSISVPSSHLWTTWLNEPRTDHRRLVLSASFVENISHIDAQLGGKELAVRGLGNLVLTCERNLGGADVGPVQEHKSVVMGKRRMHGSNPGVVQQQLPASQILSLHSSQSRHHSYRSQDHHRRLQPHPPIAQHFHRLSQPPIHPCGTPPGSPSRVENCSLKFKQPCVLPPAAAHLAPIPSTKTRYIPCVDCNRHVKECCPGAT